MTDFSPREIVSELDRFIVGQKDAKKAVAVALRNRWRRRRVPDALRDEVTPKNILMIGPTGVGKTEIARRLARLANAPFLKVEATKFTEVGYVGRDVDQIVRDLVESAIAMVRDKRRGAVRARAEAAAEERLLDALTGPGSTAARDSFRKKLRAGELDDKEVELTLADSGGMPLFDVPGQPGASMGVMNISDIMGKAFGQGRTKTHKTTVIGAWAPLIAEESDKLLDQEALTQEALELAENEGIVFLDEIDKVASRSDRAGADVSREGVQRDLLPLIEGTTVATKYGPVKTDHILFIASGAFHVAKPSDLLPELQGRL
ncbi:MAG: ATP-dependent protease ATPase subunit HslU, partial [Alphaproteobacteria bacterium]|nr:ATP-dependent protease ATPase subunit HslU [Alphaproteobacteria bacterium]